MNGVQAAIFSGSAMILLVLALRLFLKKHLETALEKTCGIYTVSQKASAARDFSCALVSVRAAVAAAGRNPHAPERLESATHTGRSAGKWCHFRRADTISGFRDQRHRRIGSRCCGHPPDASCLARLRDTFCGIFCDRICLHGTSVSRNTACPAAVH